MEAHLKTVYIIAGPNGAGKSMFVESYLNRYIDCDEFLNADLIASGLSPFAPERQALRASEIFLKSLEILESGTNSFALETTLSGLSYRRRISRWKQLGFAVSLFFLWLPSVEIAIDRVANRVLQGGHDIPEPDIRRRYQRGMFNLIGLYLPMVDDAWILNGAATPPSVIWRRFDGKVQCFQQGLWDTLINQATGES